MKDIYKKEEWRDIDGFDKKYQISSLGRISYLARNGQNIISYGHKDRSTGYMVVTLRKDNKSCPFYVHRIVAKAFLPNPKNKEEVDHINGERSDNRLENLRWATKKENMNNPITIERLRLAFTGKNSPHYGKKRSKETCKRISDALKASPLNHGRKGSKSKLSMPVHQYDNKGNYIQSFVGMAEAARVLNIPEGEISSVCCGKRKLAKGFFWSKRKLEDTEIPLYLKKLSEEYSIVQFDLHKNEIKRWKNAREAAKACGYNAKVLRNSCNGRPQTYKGYIWKYLKDI